MGTMIIELKAADAADLLHNLERQEKIRIMAEAHSGEAGERSISEKYWGILTKEEGEDLKRHIEECRSEWERDI